MTRNEELIASAYTYSECPTDVDLGSFQ